MGILTKSWSLLLAHWFISQHEEPHTQIHRWPWHLYRLFSLYNLNMTPLDFAHKPPNWLLKATSLATTFSQCGVVWLHMESNSSYSLMNEAPTDHCHSVVAAGHAGNFWAMWTHNSNCQRIKTLGEKKKSLQMFPGNKSISKWLKLQYWGNSSAGRFFTWISDLAVYM